ETASIGVRDQISDHIADSLLHSGLPAIAKSPVVSRSLICKSDSTRIVDKCTHSVFIECAGHVFRRGTLGAVARNEQRHSWQGLPQFHELFGVSRADDCTQEAVSTSASKRVGPVKEPIRNVTINGLAGGHQVLKLTCGSVAGTDKHEHAFL